MITQVGRYQIKRELGKGGMATVYLGHDPRFNRDVAVKLLPANFLDNPMFRSRFDREAQTLASLEHNAIVPVYDYGDYEDRPYLVMRYMKGKTLTEQLAGRPLTISQALPIIERIGNALDAAHGKGIIHRDLKPDNILFDEYGEAYLSDFGIVKLAQTTQNLTSTGGIIGTPAYMSPEQVQGHGKIDGRSDIYALGVVLYQMLTADLPFKGDTPFSTAMMHVLEPIPPILEKNPDLPRGIQAVIGKAMAKESIHRFANGREVSASLKEVEAAPSVVPKTAIISRTVLDAQAAAPSYAGQTGTIRQTGATAPQHSTRLQPPVGAPLTMRQQAQLAHPTAPAHVPVAPPQETAAKRRSWPIILLALMLLLAVGAGSAYVVWQNFFAGSPPSSDTPAIVDDGQTLTPASAQTGSDGGLISVADDGTLTPTLTATATQTNTPTALTNTPTATLEPSNTPTTLPTATVTNLPTHTATALPTVTPTDFPIAPPPTFTPTPFPLAPPPTLTPTPLPLAPPPSVDVVQGRVTYRNSPVSGVTVALMADACGASHMIDRVSTDGNGRYQFNAISPGNYRLAYNGWDATGTAVEPYSQSCSWELNKTNSSQLILDWTLHKTNLQITFPADGAVIGTYTPIISWQAYPDATSYDIVLIQQSPSNETLAFGEPSSGTTYTHPNPLIAGGSFYLIVWAYDSSGAQIANGSITFQTP